MAETKRVELSGGNWAEVYTQKVFRFERIAAQGLPDDATEQDGYIVHADGRSLTPGELATARAYQIIGLVKGWSYGPVTIEVLDGLPEEDYAPLMREVEAVVTAAPLPARGGANGQTPSSSRSRPKAGAPSRPNTP